MINKVQSFIVGHKLFNQKNKLLLALSGGKDSVCMVYILHLLGYRLHLAHVNFGLRGEESEADEAFCRTIANELNCPFHLRKVDMQSESHKSESTQEAARRIRYHWFESLRKTEGYDYILTAHSADDNSETMLYQMSRGGKRKMLQGITPKRGKIVRPLLCLSSDEVLRFLAERNLPYRHDKSNDETKYRRNFIRQQLIPGLKEINPSLNNTLLRTAAFQRGMNRFLEEQLKRVLKDRTAKEGKSEILNLKGLDREEQLFLCAEWCAEFELHPEALIDLLNASTGGRVYCGETLFIRERQSIARIEKDNELNNGQWNFDIREQNEVITEHFSLRWEVNNEKPAEELIRDPNIAVFDADALESEFIIRYYEKGDRFRPFGLKGSQKLSDFFVNQKIPNHRKNQIPLLCQENKILWVMPYRNSNRGRIKEATSTFLSFYYQLEKDGTNAKS